MRRRITGRVGSDQRFRSTFTGCGAGRALPSGGISLAIETAANFNSYIRSFERLVRRFVDNRRLLAIHTAYDRATGSWYFVRIILSRSVVARRDRIEIKREKHSRWRSKTFDRFSRRTIVRTMLLATTRFSRILSEYYRAVVPHRLRCS